MKARVAVLFFLLVSFVQASLPPVSELLSDVFSGRKPADALELQFRHLVQIKEGESVEVIEQFTGNRNGGIIQWQIAGQPTAFSDWNLKDYVFRNGKTIPSRTAAFIEYFLADSGNEYQERMIRERFLRRDQLLQYKPGFNPTGDPKRWETNANYLRHDDIELKKAGREFAVAVSGMSEGDQKRAFYLSRNGHGLLKLEWVVGTETASWDFSGFSAVPGIGRLPRVFSLQINGKERVTSTLAQARPVRRDAIATARAASAQPSSSAPPSALLEEAIRLIVRYR